MGMRLWEREEECLKKGEAALFIDVWPLVMRLSPGKFCMIFRFYLGDEILL
jgi:hypothetical protein